MAHCHHGHDHSHGHDHGHDDNASRRRRLLPVLVLTTALMVAEVIGGWWSNSLALLSDAGHMLSDVAALALALFALRFAERPPTQRRTFGHRRAEVLAAFANAAGLLVVVAIVLIEAIERFRAPPELAGEVGLAVAITGLLVNLAGLALLGGHGHDLNLEGAWLHILGDALGSVAAIVALSLNLALGWVLVDPIASVIISALIAVSAVGLLRRSAEVLMETAPSHIDPAAVEAAMREVAGVEDLHDLHIWTLAGDEALLTGHICIAAEADGQAVLLAVHGCLRERFGIGHATIQIERPGFPEHAACGP